jgi:hypothetical protein
MIKRFESEESSFREWNRIKHQARKRKENRNSLPQGKWPSGGRMEREENRTFVHRTSLVVRILSRDIDEAKKRPRSCAVCLKLTAPRENVRGSIQLYFCESFRLFSQISVHICHRHRCGCHLQRSAAIGGASAALGRLWRRLAWLPSAALGRHRRSFCCARPPLAALGSAAFGGARPTPLGFEY